MMQGGFFFWEFFFGDFLVGEVGGIMDKASCVSSCRLMMMMMR